MNEFSIISKFFKNLTIANKQVTLGIGDDCAAIKIPPNYELVTSIDTLVSGVHFPPNCCAYNLATRSLACATSDLAAMGAEPIGFTLALTLPCINSDWLQDFSCGLKFSAEQFNLQLIGGDLTSGSLSLTFSVFGMTPLAKSIKRNGAQVGDLLCVGDKLGAAAGVLPFILNNAKNPLEHYYWQPKPQLELGKYLQGKAHAMLDISDGLLADCTHLITASKVGAQINLAKIPVHPKLLNYYSLDKAQNLALTGGDDYVLLFCLPAQYLNDVQRKFNNVVNIGAITNSNKLTLIDANGNNIKLPQIKGYQHF